MAQFENALRFYRRLSSSDFGPVNVQQEGTKWLKEQVSPLVEDLVENRKFRAQASSPIRHFGEKSSSEELKSVRRVDIALEQVARALVALAEQDSVRDELRRQFTQVRRVRLRAPKPTGGYPCEQIERDLYEEVATPLAIAREIAAGRRGTLVNTADYFQPKDFVSIERFDDCDELLRAKIAEESPVGNWIVKCILARIERRTFWLARLHRFVSKVMEQLRTGVFVERVNEVNEALTELQSATEHLRGLPAIFADPLRDACIIGTQIYVALHQTPDIAWLGQPYTFAERSYLCETFNHPGRGLLAEVATALETLQKLVWDLPVDQDSDRDTAIAAGHLVILCDEHRVFWERVPLKKLSSISWKLLLALAQKALHGSMVDVTDVYKGDLPSNSALSSAANRLRNAIPLSLAGLIVAGRKPNSYRLDLPKDRIYIAASA